MVRLSLAHNLLRMMPLLLRVVVACAGLVALPPQAWAADPTAEADLRKAEAAATEAKVFFKAGLFDKASDKFMEAFAISRRPSLMYNAARAYEEGLNYREAVALFRHYRDLPDVGVDGKKDADDRIQRMEAALQGQASVEAARKAEQARLEAERAEVLRREREERERRDRERAALLAQPVTPTELPPPVVKSRPVPWPLVLASTGALLVAGGLYGGALYAAESGRGVQPTSLDNVNAADAKFTDAKVMRGFSIGFLAVGAGLATWAVVDWMRKPEEPVKKVVLQATADVFPVAGGGMLTVQGAF